MMFYYQNNLLYFIIVIIFVLILITLFFRSSKRQDETAAILDNRLANGEISIEEYTEIKRLIKGGPVVWCFYGYFYLQELFISSMIKKIFYKKVTLMKS